MKIDHKWSTKKKFLRFFSEELQILVRQLLRRPALVVGIDVRIDLGDLNGRVSEQGLHGTQLGAALD